MVTSALPYANGPLHIGHLSGAILSADIYVRFLRMMDKDVVYACGSDEHGAAITIRAAKEGISPKEIVDKYHEHFKKTFSRLGISFDVYHRTSDELHHKTSQDFFRELYRNGEFIEKTTEQYFDPEVKQFLADRYILGTCPKCDNDKAYGDQCENCGSTLSPTELINPKSTLSGSDPVLKNTTHWYLPLDKHEKWLKEWIVEGTLEGKEHHDPKDWKTHVLGQCNSWLDAGLAPRAMTRDLNWGVNVPEEIPGAEGKKLYVWLDAPIGYISATKYWAKENGKEWEKYWKDEESDLVHFLGKDNIVFHCLIFPSILKAHGDYNLPVNVPANQFVNLEGDKISTSRNWAVWVEDYLNDFEGKEDVLRYFLIKIMPEQKDSEFTWKGFQDACNNELVNNLANFVNRVLVLTHKYYDGVIPAYDPDSQFEGSDTDLPGFHETELLGLFDKIHVVCDHIRKFDFRSALTALMDISATGNQILQYNEPWKLIKKDPETVKAIMNCAIQFVGALSVVLKPFLPFTSDKLRGMLKLDKVKESGELLQLLDILAEGSDILPAGHKIGKSSHLFNRIKDETIQDQLDKLYASKSANQSNSYEEVKPEVEFEDFSKLDIRTGSIISAEKMPKAKKLLKIEVDLGFEQRTVVSGIAQHYKSEEIIGKQVLVLVNLKPRKLRGVESQGMILMAEDANGVLTFVSPEKQWEPGHAVK